MDRKSGLQIIDDILDFSRLESARSYLHGITHSMEAKVLDWNSFASLFYRVKF